MLAAIIILAVFSILLAAFALLQNRQVRKLLVSLDDMLAFALNRTLQPGYEDSLKSTFEHKFYKYIAVAETARQKLEADKLQVRSLISDISHQTKTSMANIKLYSQMLAEKASFQAIGMSNAVLEECNIKNSADEILHHTSRLEFLIDALVKMSRLETGLLLMHPETIPASELISLALSPYFMKATEKGISVIVDCGVGISFFCDKKWTAEAVGNIIDNAVKYAGTGVGKIAINVKKLEMYTVIRVQDNGIRLEELETQDIFKRFYRGNNARALRGAGSDGIGIGLYIAREIMSAQGGYVTASVEEGEMPTVFSVFVYNQI
jgi:signal transduction histidine kinase